MRKQVIQAGSFEMPNEFNCSSIRINEEDYTGAHQEGTKQQLNIPKGINLKQFEQHSLNGLEGSNLSMSTNRDRILELMRSKSAKQLINHGPKQNPLELSDSQNIPGISLFNTSSFDDMTMKMTLRNNHNISAVSNQTQGKNQPQLKKPKEMTKFKATYADSDMRVILSKQTNKSMNEEVSVKEEGERRETKPEKEARLRKVAQFGKRQNLMDNLKCSNVESEHSRNLEESEQYQEPCFRQPSVLYENPLVRSEKGLKPSLVDRKPSIRVQTRNQERQKYQMNSPPSTTSKLTLRDYINLNNFMAKSKESQASSPVSMLIGTPQLSRMDSPRSSNSTNRRKLQSTNTEVISHIRRQICGDLRQLQSSVGVLLSLFEGQGGQGASQSEVMHMFGLSRIVKQRMLGGNDELVLMMKKHKEANSGVQ